MAYADFDIILNVKTAAFSLRSEQTWMLTLAFLFIIALEVLIRTIREKKKSQKRKRIITAADGIVLCMENTID